MIVSEWRYDWESESECHLIPEVSPCVSTQERPSQSWIVSFQRLGCTSCLNTITAFSPCTHLTHILTLNIPQLFCFWEVYIGGPRLPLSSYLSKLDAGLGCLNASVKLWCGCLILGSMHLPVFTIIILKKVDETRLAEWKHLVQQFISECPDQWRVEDGWSVQDGDLKSPDFQSHIPTGWFCLMNDLYWRLGVKRSMSLLSFDGVCMCNGSSHFHFAADTAASTAMECFIKTGFSSAALVYWQYSPADDRWWTNKCLTEDKKRVDYWLFILFNLYTAPCLILGKLRYMYKQCLMYKSLKMCVY